MNKTIYVFWTEGNELTPRRKNNLEILRSKCGVNLQFLQDKEIYNFELIGHKFHEGYSYLSATAKSDYLRSYFMNFYGGAYCDIKRAEWDWNNYFDSLERSNDWIMGYNLSCDIDVAVFSKDDNFKNMKQDWKKLIGAGAMICKKDTPLTNYWFNLMTEILDKKLDLLKKYPAQHVRDRQGWVTNSGYPLRWSEIGPETFMKSCYMFVDKINYSLPSPILNEKYR